MNDLLPSSALKARLGAILEVLLNEALGLDPDLPGELAALDGRSLTLRWSGPDWALRIAVDGARLRVGPADDAGSDLSLKATLSGLVGLLRPAAADSLPAGRVQIAGDAELLRRIERLGKRFDPDWELALANRLGPVFGPQLARQLQAAFAWLKTSGQSLAESGAEYLREEGRDSIARPEQDALASDIAALRDAVERAEARLRRLAARLDRP
ncbi:MAG: SCP2 domain-containing protein [Lysobacterales bacterium]